MPVVQLTTRFIAVRKKFVRRNAALAITVRETLVLFAKNPSHPGLHLEKLSGTRYWTIRIDRGNRLFFMWSTTGDTATFFFVGPHDIYKNI